jgi:hypothetical protein
VGGQFIKTPCAPGTQCFALPLVNKPGTSLACTTQKEAADRIAATGATGGISVDNNTDLKTGTPNIPTKAAPAPASAPSPSASSSPAAPETNPQSFVVENSLAAQQENARASTLDATSPCKEGETTCVGSALGQCSGGKFIITQCAAPTKCLVLPLVDKAGTTPNCTTESDAAASIAGLDFFTGWTPPPMV